MIDDYHEPVLLQKAIDLLATDPRGVYVDGTLGGGGHTAEILRRLKPGGTVHAFDKDKNAISHCESKFREELGKGDNSRLVLHNDCYSKACGLEEAQGLLLDLGVSSRQLDKSERGFSFRENRRLDMRFGSRGETTAEALLNAAPEEELERIFRVYGEEPFSKATARRIGEMRRVVPLKFAFDLRDAVVSSAPKRFHTKSLARVFQAVRIAVNDELRTLEYTLTNFLPILRSGGRIVVISYHSLEDRIVKNFFKENSVREKFNKYAPPKAEIFENKLKTLVKKPISPEESEIAANPRSRSAKLRAAEKY